MVASARREWFVPFPLTRAERERTGDPRASVEERYRGRADYLGKVEQVTRRLAAQRYVLERDVTAIVEAAGSHWDWRLAETAPRGSASSRKGRR